MSVITKSVGSADGRLTVGSSASIIGSPVVTSTTESVEPLDASLPDESPPHDARTTSEAATSAE